MPPGLGLISDGLTAVFSIPELRWQHVTSKITLAGIFTVSQSFEQYTIHTNEYKQTLFALEFWG